MNSFRSLMVKLAAHNGSIVGSIPAGSTNDERRI